MTSTPAAATPTPVSDRRLRIALVCDWYLPRFGGLELQVEQLARGLAGRGHDVHVVTGVPDARADRDARASAHDPVRVHRLQAPVFPGHGFVYTPGAFSTLKALIVEHAFDVVHCHVSYVAPTAFAGAFLAQRMGLPTVVTFHSFLGKFRVVLATLNLVFRWSRWPVVFSAVSQAIADEVRPLLQRRTIRLLPNGVTRNEWTTTPVDRRNDVVVLITVMRLKVRKRPRALLRILHAVRRRVDPHHHVKLIVIGDGPERPGVERLSRRLSLDGAVEFMGFQSTAVIRDAFANSDVFVLPTVLESFGIAALEARYAGLPVVARRQSGVSEFIEHGRNGLLASSDAEMVEHVARLIEDTPLRRQIAAYNRGDPSDQFDWRSVLDRNLAAYAAATTRRCERDPAVASG